MHVPRIWRQVRAAVNPPKYTREDDSLQTVKGVNNFDNGNPIAFPVTVDQNNSVGANGRVVQFLDRLESVPKIRSIAEEKLVAEWAEEVWPALQDNRTMSDEDRLQRIENYRLVIGAVLDRCTMPVREAGIQQLFVANADLDLTAQCLEVLLQFNDQSDFEIKLQLLDNLFSDEYGIVSALVQGCADRATEQQQSGIYKINRELTKDRLITRLVNVPTIIANFARGSAVNASFLDMYVRTAYRNVLRAWIAVAECNDKTECKVIFNHGLLGKLLSKMIMHFSAHSNVVELDSFLKIICVLCQHNASLKTALTELMATINNCQAIETIIRSLLCKGGKWKDVLSPTLIDKSPDWRFVVTKSLPLRGYVRNEDFPGLFVQFLRSFANDENQVMKEILGELLSCWSLSEDRSLDQHTYISRMIIYLIIALKEDNHMDNNLQSQVKAKIYNGMSGHLQSLDLNLRFIGMRMAEIVLNLLEDVPLEDQLDFGAAKLNVNARIQKLFEEFSLKKDDSVEYDEERILQELEVSTKIITNPIGPVEEKKTIKTQKSEDLDSDDDEAPLDEDDDLIPYNMSNDLSELETVAPKYLLDLKEILVSSTDDKNNAEKFQVGVQVCAELIKHQLPLNDPRLGIELLSILVTLNNKVYNEQFTQQRFDGCVAVMTVIPKEAAEFLCREFYADAGSYAISHRVLMLEILSEAARRLSSIEEQKENARNPSTVSNVKKLIIADDNAEKKKVINKIITDRLADKTRRFINGPSNEPVKGINRFHAVAGSFVFPLIHGFGRKQIMFQSRTQLKDDTVNVLLQSFLKTLCVITLCSENAPNIARIVQEELHLIALVKFYTEEAIQMTLLELIGCLISVTPKHMMAKEFLQSFLEIKAWLEDFVERNAFNPDMKKESRELAQRLLAYL